MKVQSRGVTFANIIDEIGEFVSDGRHNASEFAEWLSNRELIKFWDRRDVYQACLGRLPEREIGSEMWSYESRLDCANHVVSSILSNEFMINVVKIIGDARPDIRRTFFIHIPKTAGTAVRVYLEKNFHSICWNAVFGDDPYWLAYEAGKVGKTPLEFMLHFIGQFRYTNEIVVVGHKSLLHWHERRLIRSGDRAFSVTRNPREMVISGLAYICGQIMSDSCGPDANSWRDVAKYLESSKDDFGLEKVIDVKSMLRSDRFVYEFRNNITKFLSYDGTAEGVVDLTRLVKCDVIGNDEMEMFLKDFTGSSEAIEIHNRSEFDVISMIDDEDINYIDYYLCHEDEKTLRLLGSSQRSIVGSMNCTQRPRELAE